ncbi:hypothetical protein B0H66DRAFT_588117 [Apodospora peruviana]|uniref:Nicotinamide N-methyltransferase n=1 Tax=Apodospora peruviana TaxID=516989 RepID=A0AAE0IHK3_9PEZI|nr:hypothetical protein B0H66DRAFT_588117 [Apodospora peruviana]
MPSLTARLTELTESTSAEDLLASSLGVVFPDDVAAMHGDAEHDLLYTSPHLPKPFVLSLADPKGFDEETRGLFSHYLWNSSLQLAEFIEAGTLLARHPKPKDGDNGGGGGSGVMITAGGSAEEIFDVTGLSTIELGAGTALPSIMAALLGAKRVVVTDYPAPAVMETLRRNVSRVVRPEFAPLGRMIVAATVTVTSSTTTAASEDSDETPSGGEEEKEQENRGGGVEVHGHSWGDLSSPLAKDNHHAFDRVIAADCLWMPWHHESLRWSMDWFLSREADARVWIVAGHHTGRGNTAAFFDEGALGRHGLVVERILERDCDGVDREWAVDRGAESVSERKRWLVVAVLKRKPTEAAVSVVSASGG